MKYKKFLSTPYNSKLVTIELFLGSIFHGYILELGREFMCILLTENASLNGFIWLPYESITRITQSELDQFYHTHIFVPLISGIALPELNAGMYIFVEKKDQICFTGELREMRKSFLILRVGENPIHIHFSDIFSIRSHTPLIAFESSLDHNISCIPQRITLELCKKKDFIVLKGKNGETQEGFIIDILSDAFHIALVKEAIPDGYSVIKLESIEYILLYDTQYSNMFHKFLGNTIQHGRKGGSFYELLTQMRQTEIIEIIFSDGTEDYGRILSCGEKVIFQSVDIYGKNEMQFERQKDEIVQCNYETSYTAILTQFSQL